MVHLGRMEHQPRRFLRDARWLDNLRLRVSYGAQGNIDRTTSPYILGTWNSTSLGGASETAST